MAANTKGAEGSATSNRRLRKAALWQELVISGISVGGATTCTNPLDVIKTRLQLYTRKMPGATKPGLVRTGINIVRDEGVLSLWNGLPPAIARGFLYGGMRLGLYGPIKEALVGLAAGESQASASLSSSSSTATATSLAAATTATTTAAAARSATPAAPQGFAGFALKAAAGTLSGAIAAGLTSPTELVKTRLQAKGNQAQSTLGVVRQVVQESGVAGLWRGAVPSMARAALLTSSQVATYDSVKHEIMHATGWGDCAGTHLAASSFTGLVTTTVTNPADVIKTNMFVSGGGVRKGISQTAADIFRADGVAGFFKGWTANYARLGPQTVITFLISEALRSALGLEGL
ncbi:hypothetical protein Agub_g6678 [Astrephomene gubernaculifera]|uniref:Uncharacterized protein n=1 Tax=Astrephomene gubernaculifera TaxID=47775 RepID=A0AAD3HM47_9CHLO|nr:hypothetical protein Agub_g6678 [Astrephomene gubernaculifera]